MSDWRQNLIDDDAGLTTVLREARVVAVLGAKAGADEPAHYVPAYLLAQGYRILPVNPNAGTVLGVPAVGSLRELSEPVDVVDVFRRSEQVAPVVDEAIAIGAKVLWMQDGVIDPDGARRAHDAGLRVVMNRCMLRDHRRLIGG